MAAIAFVPTEHLAILMGLMMFQVLAFGGNLVGEDAVALEELETPDGFTDIEGVAGFVTGMFEVGLAVFTVMAKLVTFAAVPGLPSWIRVPLSLYMGTITTLVSVQVVTALGGVASNLVPFT